MRSSSVSVDVWVADWCTSCKPVVQAAEKLRGEGRPVRVVDYDANRAEAAKRGVRRLPTSILYIDGREKKRAVGVVDRSFLLNWLSESGG